MPEKLICPHCLMSNAIDCREKECPGERGFVSATWRRPFLHITRDFDHYETLILNAAELFEKHPVSEAFAGTALLFINEAKTILAKQKKEGRARGNGQDQRTGRADLR